MPIVIVSASGTAIGTVDKDTTVSPALYERNTSDDLLVGRSGALVTAAPVADSELRNNANENDNLGSATTIGPLYSTATTNTRRAVYRFAMPPPGSRRVRLHRRCTANTGTPTLRLMLMENNADSISFVEGECTWNISKTGVNWGTAGGGAVDGTSITYTGPTANTDYIHDIQTIFEAADARGDAFLTLLEKIDVENATGSSTWASKENATEAFRPYISYDPPLNQKGFVQFDTTGLVSGAIGATVRVTIAEVNQGAPTPSEDERFQFTYPPTSDAGEDVIAEPDEDVWTAIDSETGPIPYASVTPGSLSVGVMTFPLNATGVQTLNESIDAVLPFNLGIRFLESTNELNVVLDRSYGIHLDIRYPGGAADRGLDSLGQLRGGLVS